MSSTSTSQGVVLQGHSLSSTQKKPCYLADLTSLSSSQLSLDNKLNVSMLWNQAKENGFRGHQSDDYDAAYPMIHGVFGMSFNNTHDRMMSDHQKEVGLLPFDEVQEWTVRGAQWHPFHMHGQPFQIAALPSKEELVEKLIGHDKARHTPLGSYLNNTIWSLVEDDDGWFQVGDWADTFHDLGSYAVLRVAPRIQDMGTMVFHCHYLNHEDQGMMTYVDVEPGSSSCTKGVQCAKALDPQCYSDSVEAGFRLKGETTHLRR